MARPELRVLACTLVAAAVAAAGGSGGAVSAAPGVSFAPPKHCFCAGVVPAGVAIGDMNGDGHADVAIADHGSADVTVLLGKGDGTFRDPLRFPLPDHPHAIALGDLNHDGTLDVVAGNQDTASVYVLLGRRDGTLQSPLPVEVGASVSAIAIADLNDDGDPDLVTTDLHGRNAVSVLLGRGDGTFDPPRRYAVGNDPSAVAIDDVNGDSIPDVVTADAAGGVSLLLGRGDGTFAAAKRIPVGKRPIAVLLRDLNGDGRLDLLVYAAGAHEVEALAGHGDGTFGSPTGYPVDGSSALGDMAAADLNEDGNVDVATVNAASRDVSVLLGNGDGTFQPEQRFPTFGGARSIALGNLTGDLWPDAVTTRDTTPGDVPVLANTTGAPAPSARGGPRRSTTRPATAPGTT
jgi:hypothetical protein